MKDLPKRVRQAIQSIDYEPRGDKRLFATVLFNNGYVVQRCGDHALFVASCLMVYDLPDKFQ